MLKKLLTIIIYQFISDRGLTSIGQACLQNTLVSQLRTHFQAGGLKAFGLM